MKIPHRNLLNSHLHADDTPADGWQIPKRHKQQWIENDTEQELETFNLYEILSFVADINEDQETENTNAHTDTRSTIRSPPICDT